MELMKVNQNVGVVQHNNISDLAERYLAFLDVKPKTAETYTRQVRLFVRYLQENGIRDPNRQTIIDWKNSLVQSGHTPSTVQTYLSSVRLFFQWTESEELYPNICIHIKAPTVSHDHHRDFLTAEQICAVLGAIDRSSSTGLRDYAMIYLAVTAGLRTVELSRAKIGDIRNHGHILALYVWGKARDEKSDYVQIIPAVETAIREYLATRPNTDPDDFLFTSTSHRNQNEGLTTRSISRIIKDRFKAVGLDSDRLTAHSLRHSAITLAIRNGESLQSAQQFARHSNVKTTEIYFHELENEDNQCSNVIGKCLADTMKGVQQ